ncbi:Tetratricopeptide repeat protein [Planctomycetales bacterium 10988]|nr:Tetratricopeptide repeat protein [Planctomycetales bacterium 10988]
MTLLVRHLRMKHVVNEAEGYLELGMPEHSLKAIARATDLLSPEEDGERLPRFHRRLLLLKGEALRLLERYEEALVPLEEAAQHDQQNLELRISIAWCYKRVDQLDRAIETLEGFQVLDPQHAIIPYNLACYWSLAGDKERALAYLETSFQMDESFRQLTAEETDFDAIREDEGFQSLTKGSLNG